MRKATYLPRHRAIYFILAFVLLYAQTAALLHAQQHSFHKPSALCAIYTAMERSVADVFPNNFLANYSVSYFLVETLQSFQAKVLCHQSCVFHIRAPPVS